MRDHLLAGSVLSTGLLPGWRGGDDQLPAHDSSALGGVVPFPASRPSVQWDRVNTDAMSLRLERGVVPAGRNAARVGDRTLSPVDYEAQIAEGFEAVYRLLLREREALRAGDGPLAVMRGQPVRFIYRPTRIYSALIAASWKPELLRSGIEYGIHLERLARAFLVSRERPNVWPVFAAEVLALEQGDVPLFTARTDATSLELDGRGLLLDAFTAPSHDAVLERLSELGDDDLERQLLVIRAALQAKAARSPSGTDDRPPPDLRAAPALPSGRLVDAATAIGLEIERHALSDGTQSVSWIGLRYLDGADRYQLDVLGDSLYDGCPGVALFLAALGRATGDRRFGALALRGLHELRGRLRATDPGSRRVVARAQGLGGAVGLGSVIYALVRTSAFIDGDGPALIEDAARLAAWLTPELIADDEKLDVLSGSAGALLGLLALHSATGEDTVLQAAVDCGDHLLRHRVETNGHRVWRTVAERPLTGFSHGAAGIAYALARLYGATGERSYLEAARGGDRVRAERLLGGARRLARPPSGRRSRPGRVPREVVSRGFRHRPGAPGLQPRRRDPGHRRRDRRRPRRDARAVPPGRRLPLLRQSRPGGDVPRRRRPRVATARRYGHRERRRARSTERRLPPLRRRRVVQPRLLPRDGGDRLPAAAGRRPPVAVGPPVGVTPAAQQQPA